jgi:hypothetical protein
MDAGWSACPLEPLPSPAHVRLQRNLQWNPHEQARGAFRIAPKLIAPSAEPGWKMIIKAGGSHSPARSAPARAGGQPPAPARAELCGTGRPAGAAQSRGGRHGPAPGCRVFP